MSDKSERYLELSNAVHRAYLGTLQNLEPEAILDLLQEAYWVGLDLTDGWPSHAEDPPF